MRREFLAFGDDLVGGHEQRGAAADRGARAERAGADRDLVGIAELVAHAVGRDAELVGDDLPEGGRVALAVIMRAHGDGERTGRIEAQLGVLDQAGVRGLDGVGDADAAQLAAPSGLPPPRLEAAVVGKREAIVEVLSEIAAVVGVDQRGLVRHRLGGNGVAAAKFRAVDAELARGEIDQRLQHIRCLRAGRRRDRGRSAWCWCRWHSPRRDRPGTCRCRRARRYCWSAGRHCGRKHNRRRCWRSCAPGWRGIFRRCRAQARLR